MTKEKKTRQRPGLTGRKTIKCLVTVLSAKMCLIAVEEPDPRGNGHDSPTGKYIVGRFPNPLVKY